MKKTYLLKTIGLVFVCIFAMTLHTPVYAKPTAPCLKSIPTGNYPMTFTSGLAVDKPGNNPIVQVTWTVTRINQSGILPPITQLNTMDATNPLAATSYTFTACPTTITVWATVGNNSEKLQPPNPIFSVSPGGNSAFLNCTAVLTQNESTVEFASASCTSYAPAN